MTDSDRRPDSMSATAQPSALPRTPSTRRQPAAAAYNGTADRDRPHRTQSTSTRPTTTSSPRRSQSTNQTSVSSSHNRNPSGNPANGARQDTDQTGSVPRHPTASRRPESHDASAAPTRSESTRHARTHSRYNSDQPTAAAGSGNANTEGRSSHTTHGTQNLRRRTTVDAQTGHWDLGKTIGAGSMGKVKLARNKETGEQVAVKIIPRQSNEGEHKTQAERDRADHSKEVRTQREAAIVTLVDHPYICGMRDVVRTNYHWYMLFEYVNGGQMLDYIISHGRLKEKQARKFGRQIASALDYCHRNSIVHRDLKIENILISKNGDIKIIDFGLSNLFSPRGLLKTFCGSLYFAAPELLQAKQYTGPEVDVWSFGIVLYVLVCGKVPFDDQSMPQLHAKIKKGIVDYPPWLTLECRSLITRMLNTNPAERATMTEILNHPWMNKGFNGPPENYLAARKTVQLPLDSKIIDKMTGFDFGSAEYITTQLTKIIESEDYQRAVRAAEKQPVQQPQETEKKRGVFDFYKRRNSTTSRDTLNTPSSEGLQLGNDPINAFHPLISVYYLAMEKQEREAREKNPGGLSLHGGEKQPYSQTTELAAPAKAVTNSAAYEMAGEKPTGGRNRPRARTHGEDEVQQGLQNLNINTAASPTNPAIVEPPSEQSSEPRKESMVSSIARRLSTRRHKDPSERAGRTERASGPPPSLGSYGANENVAAEGSRKSFTMRRTREREPSATGLRPETAQTGTGNGTGLLTPPGATDGTADVVSKKSHGLGRSISVNSSDVRRRFSRRGVSEGSHLRPQMNAAASHDSKAAVEQRLAGRGETTSDVENTHRPAAGNLASRTKSLGHARKESMQQRRIRRAENSRTEDVPEETNQDMQEEMYNDHTGSHSPTGFKPVYLKGVFSVSTTSSKPLQFIRSDLIRVLKQLGVDFTEIKGGFRCRHSPSIKASAEENTNPSSAQYLGSPEGSVHRRKISFGGLRDRSAGDRDSFRAQQSSRGKPSYNNSEEESDDENQQMAMRNNASRAPGETTTHVQSDLGSNMVLKFEIFVVKVPLLSLHGIQFKKVDGGTWQYKNMAQTILNELKL